MLPNNIIVICIYNRVLLSRLVLSNGLNFFVGDSNLFGSLYFEVKHMFLYRDPVKNILSILSLNGSMPKFITRRFMTTMKTKLLSGLSPDPKTSQKALADLDKGLEEGDDHMFGIIFYTLHILLSLIHI